MEHSNNGSATNPFFGIINYCISSQTLEVNPWIFTFLLQIIFCVLHVIGVHLLSQSAPEKHNQEKQSHTMRSSCLSKNKLFQRCLVIIKSCYFDDRINNL